ncbi:unnamed protein product [Dovyalis caffra]|uniref:AB hydrolase-1 domain-containing protein n=1 Tax=Dovyalis caffra TaxID=77055 RepID=A0AAV1RR85_9ROSI|nr:unnamed protein product [Dovyalis caffra]
MGIVQEAHNVKVLGSGIVLGHGFGTDQSIIFDFERYSTVEGYVCDLLAILEEPQVKSCICVGHSFSGMIGAIASITRADLFSKIIMLSATPRVPSHILQSIKDMAVPLTVCEYLHQNLGGRSIVEVMPVGGHPPQLSSPDIVIPEILKHINLL